MTQPSRRNRYDTRLDRAFRLARREIVFALGVLLVVFNTVASIGLGASAKADSPMFADILGDHIVICTASGMVVVDREGRPLSDHTPPAEHSDAQCVYCLPLMQGNSIAPPLESAPIEREARAAQLPEFAGAEPVHLFRPFRLWARGPPIA